MYLTKQCRLPKETALFFYICKNNIFPAHPRETEELTKKIQYDRIETPYVGGRCVEFVTAKKPAQHNACTVYTAKEKTSRFAKKADREVLFLWGTQSNI